MFEKIGRYAETVATNASLSRRGFLGRVGQAALATAGVLGSLLVLPNKARAKMCDNFQCGYCCGGAERVITSCGGCPHFPGCKLNFKANIGECTCPPG